MIKGIIPAAGKGTRLYPYPGNKELFPIGYTEEDGKERIRVVAEYSIESMIKAGAEEIYMIINHEKADVIKFFGNGKRFGVRFVYLVQEESVGMPQALNLANNFITRQDTVLFAMPDTIFNPPDVFERLLEERKKLADDALVLGTFPTDFPWKFGMVDYTNKTKIDMEIRDIVDKPTWEVHTDWAWGNAVWGKKFMNFMETYIEEFERVNDASKFELVLGNIFRHYPDLYGIRFEDGEYFDIGTSGELKKTLDYFNK